MSNRIYIPRLAARGLVAPRTGVLPRRPRTSGCGGPACGIPPRTGAIPQGQKPFPPYLRSVAATIVNGGTDGFTGAEVKFPVATRVDAMYLDVANADAAGAFSAKYCNRQLFDSLDNSVLDPANGDQIIRYPLGLFVPAGQSVFLTYTAYAAVGANRIIHASFVGTQAKGCDASVPMPAGEPDEVWAATTVGTVAANASAMGQVTYKMAADTVIDDIYTTVIAAGAGTTTVKYCNRTIFDTVATALMDPANVGSAAGNTGTRKPLGLFVPAGQEIVIDHTTDAAWVAGGSVYFSLVGRQAGCN